MIWMLWGALALMAWQLLGLLFLRLWRRDLAVEAATALLNMNLWPAGVFAQGIIWPIVKRRREKARQARITAAVEAGQYTAQWARQALNWKG